MVTRCFKFLTGVPLKARTYTQKTNDCIFKKGTYTAHSKNRKYWFSFMSLIITNGTKKVYITILDFIQALVSLLKYNPSSSKRIFI